MTKTTEQHSGSGVGNLAFSLLITGGSHPRKVTAVQVAGIGVEKAAQIFYRAQSHYLSSNANYPAWRTACVQAATDIYGAMAPEVQSVNDAWQAVNVPGSGAKTDDSDVLLLNAKAKTGVSGSRGQKLYFAIDVPTGAKSLTVSTQGGTGNVDMYLRYNKKPQTWWPFYAEKSTSSDTNETVTVAPKAGRYWVLLKAVDDFSGVSIVANY